MVLNSMAILMEAVGLNLHFRGERSKSKHSEILNQELI